VSPERQTGTQPSNLTTSKSDPCLQYEWFISVSVVVVVVVVQTNMGEIIIHAVTTGLEPFFFVDKVLLIPTTLLRLLFGCCCFMINAALLAYFPIRLQHAAKWTASSIVTRLSVGQTGGMSDIIAPGPRNREC
jgi:hypothetical protein